jgi:AraC-like DNA-binding protein
VSTRNKRTSAHSLPGPYNRKVIPGGAANLLPPSHCWSPRPGGAGVLAKLAEVLFIEVLRLYMNEQSEGRIGWLAGVGDRIVGPALTALHARPAHAWTLEELANNANTSRSVLAERFQELVGGSPMQYLTQWRMLLAANLLCRSNAPLARIAEDVGYQMAHRRRPGAEANRYATTFVDAERSYADGLVCRY